MFRLSSEELQRIRDYKPIQSTEEIFEALGFGNIVEPDVKVEMSTAFHEVFERYARIVNPNVRDEYISTALAARAKLLIRDQALLNQN